MSRQGAKPLTMQVPMHVLVHGDHHAAPVPVSGKQGQREAFLCVSVLRAYFPKATGIYFWNPLGDKVTTAIIHRGGGKIFCLPDILRSYHVSLEGLEKDCVKKDMELESIRTEVLKNRKFMQEMAELTTRLQSEMTNVRKDFKETRKDVEERVNAAVRGMNYVKKEMCTSIENMAIIEKEIKSSSKEIENSKIVMASFKKDVDHKYNAFLKEVLSEVEEIKQQIKLNNVMEKFEEKQNLSKELENNKSVDKEVVNNEYESCEDSVNQICEDDKIMDDTNLDNLDNGNCSSKSFATYITIRPKLIKQK